MGTQVPVPQQQPQATPNVASNVAPIAAAAQSLGPQQGVTEAQMGQAPKAQPTPAGGIKGALTKVAQMAAIGIGPTVASIAKQHTQQEQTRNQHVIDTVWQAHVAETGARNKVQQYQQIIQQIDQHMKDVQALPDSDPSKIGQMGYLAHIHQQVVGEFKQQAQIIKQSQQTTQSLLAEPKNRKILAKAVGYDEKAANTPERQQMIAAIQKTQKGASQQEAQLESQFSQGPSQASPGLPVPVQQSVLKGAEDQATLEEKDKTTTATLAEKGREVDAKNALTAAQQKATEEFRQADLQFKKDKEAWDTDQHNPIVKAKMLDSQSKALSAQASMLRAHNDVAKTGDTSSPALIDQIGTGKIAADRLGYLLARNPALLNAVVAKYPDFDSSKAASYPKVYADFTSTKNGTAGGALNAGGTALTHLEELRKMNTPASHIYGTPAYNAYMNKVDTVSSELAKFYGDATIPAIKAIKETLTSTLPGNRDAAIRTQAQSMGDKLDSYEQSWKNAAPSKAYEAPLPGISDKAMKARAALDPAYAKRSGTSKPPDGADVQVPGKDGKMYWGNSKTKQVLGEVQ